MVVVVVVVVVVVWCGVVVCKYWKLIFRTLGQLEAWLGQAE